MIDCNCPLCNGSDIRVKLPDPCPCEFCDIVVKGVNQLAKILSSSNIPSKVFISGNSDYTIGFISHVAFRSRELAVQHFKTCDGRMKCDTIQEAPLK